MIYCEEDDEKQTPIIVTQHGEDMLIVEVRSYYKGQKRGATWNILTWDQARRLRDGLTEWLIENPKKVV